MQPEGFMDVINGFKVVMFTDVVIMSYRRTVTGTKLNQVHPRWEMVESFADLSPFSLLYRSLLRRKIHQFHNHGSEASGPCGHARPEAKKFNGQCPARNYKQNSSTVAGSV